MIEKNGRLRLGFGSFPARGLLLATPLILSLFAPLAAQSAIQAPVTATAATPTPTPAPPVAAAMAVQVASPPSAQAPPPPVATPAAVPAKPPAPTPPPTTQTLQQQLSRLQAQIAATDGDDQLIAFGVQAATLQKTADGLAANQAADLAKLNARLAPPARTTAGKRATPHQKRELEAQRSTLQAQVKQDRLVATNAARAYAAAAEKRRATFDSNLFEQTASPLSPDFWTSLGSALQPDLDRLQNSGMQAVSTAWNAPEPQAAIGLVVAAALAAALLFPLRHLLEGLGRRRAKHRAAAQAFRRSAYALWMTVVDIALPALAATVLLLTARWAGVLSSEADSLAQAFVTAAIWGATVVALGRVLIAPGDPDRRMLPIDEDAAKRLQAFPWIVAVVTGAGLLLTHLNTIIGASIAATVAANCVITVGYVAVAGMILVALGQGRKPLDESESSTDAASSSGLTLVSLGLTIAILVALGAVLAGYTTLGERISGQVFWLGVLAAITYLLLRFIDEVCGELFSPHGWAARALFRIFNLRASVIAQLGVLLSAGLSVLLLVSVLTLALTPFGHTGQTLFAHLGGLGRPLRIGSLSISPSAIAAGLASLAVGIALVRFVQGWLNQRFLPVTDWDSGVRNSVSKGIGYIGVGLAIVWGFAIAGLGFQQIALVASALSVGIGFGLQQVVQNFVSGLILLVERPVKVGDWVNLGGQEGDIKNIRVRATEIVTADRTTLIVPNSDFITKTVQNKTLGNARGRVQILIAISRVQDADRAKALILATFADNPEVLSEPKSNVFIDSVDPGAVNFKCLAFVHNPRDVYRIRSDLFFEMIRRMLKEEIMFPGGGMPAMAIEPGQGLKDMFDRLEPKLAQAGSKAESQPAPS